MTAPRVDLAAGDRRATLSAQGAALVSLQHAGRDLLFDVPEARVPTPPYRGMVLAPWPNRIRDGRWTLDGETHQLPVNEVGRGCALHGLALWDAWETVTRGADEVEFGHRLHARPGYPFELELRARYRLTPERLEVELTATNAGDRPAPVGLSCHPYVSAGDGGTLDGWTLQLPCDEVIDVDDRLLPRSVVPATKLGLDFTTPSAIGERSVDHAFVVTRRDAVGGSSARLVGRDGRGVELGWDAASGWLQVYTLDKPGTSMHRRAVAIEPMTCAPDAFNSGAGLTSLAPGESLRTRMWFATVG